MKPMIPRMLLVLLALLLAGSAFLPYMKVEPKDHFSYHASDHDMMKKLISEGYFDETVSLWEFGDNIINHGEAEEHIAGYVYFYPFVFVLILLLMGIFGFATPAVIFSALLAGIHWVLGHEAEVVSADRHVQYTMQPQFAHYGILVIAACAFVCGIWLFFAKRRVKKAGKAQPAAA